MELFLLHTTLMALIFQLFFVMELLISLAHGCLAGGGGGTTICCPPSSPVGCAPSVPICIGYAGYGGYGSYGGGGSYAAPVVVNYPRPFGYQSACLGGGCGGTCGCGGGVGGGCGCCCGSGGGCSSSGGGGCGGSYAGSGCGGGCAAVGPSCGGGGCTGCGGGGGCGTGSYGCFAGGCGGGATGECAGPICGGQSCGGAAGCAASSGGCSSGGCSGCNSVGGGCGNGGCAGGCAWSSVGCAGNGCGSNGDGCSANCGHAGCGGSNCGTRGGSGGCGCAGGRGDGVQRCGGQQVGGACAGQPLSGQPFPAPSMPCPMGQPNGCPSGMDPQPPVIPQQVLPALPCEGPNCAEEESGNAVESIDSGDTHHPCHGSHCEGDLPTPAPAPAPLGPAPCGSSSSVPCGDTNDPPPPPPLPSLPCESSPSGEHCGTVAQQQQPCVGSESGCRGDEQKQGHIQTAPPKGTEGALPSPLPFAPASQTMEHIQPPPPAEQFQATEEGQEGPTGEGGDGESYAELDREHEEEAEEQQHSAAQRPWATAPSPSAPAPRPPAPPPPPPDVAPPAPPHSLAAHPPEFVSPGTAPETERVAASVEQVPEQVAAVAPSAQNPYEEVSGVPVENSAEEEQEAAAEGAEGPSGQGNYEDEISAKEPAEEVTGLSCEDPELRNIVEGALKASADNLEAARKIESEAAAKFGGRFNSIVSNNEFAYVNWYGKRNCQLRVGERHSLTWED